MGEQATETPEVREWFANLIGYFRREFLSLSADEQKFVSNAFDYRPPCQVEIIWLKQPERQLVITSHFTDRPDLEVLVDGPFVGRELVSKLEEILGLSRWSRPIQSSRPGRATTYAEVLASRLNQFLVEAKESMFAQSDEPGPRSGSYISNGIWTQSYSGNVTKTDYVPTADEAIAEIKARHLASLTAQPSLSLQQPETAPQGFMTFFYPPISLGPRPKPTVSNILRGATYLIPPQGKAFDTTFQGNDMIVSMSGSIFVASSQKNEALKILNTIMAVGTLRGMDLYAVRENELGQGTYDKTKKELGGSSYPLSTMRMMQADIFGRPHLYATETEPRKMIEVMKEAEQLYSDVKLAEELRLFIESYTHLNDAEYAQSFILSWTIIERFLYEVWGRKLFQMDIDEERQTKLLNTAQWSTDYIIEILNMTHDLSELEYSEYMELKSKRNRFTHKGKTLSKDDAERCIKTARQIIMKKLQPSTT